MQLKKKESNSSESSEYQILGEETTEGRPIVHHHHRCQSESAQCPLNEDHQLKMGLIVQQSTYVVLESHEKCSHSEKEWKQLLLKKKKEVALKNQSEVSNSTLFISRLSFCQRHSILSIPFHNRQKRMELWSIANFNEAIEEQYREIQEYEVSQREQRKKQFEDELPFQERKAFKVGVSKITQIFKKILSNNLCQQKNNLSEEWFIHLKALKTNEDLILSWIQRALQRCALEQTTIRYCKGIIFSYPEINYAKYTQLFDHFLKINEFSSFYIESSPKYYSQLNKISISLKEQQPHLNQMICNLEGNLQNLFISYFRSLLLYRVTNPELIRKIFQLLFVEGPTIIKTIVLRVLSELTPYLLKNDHPLENIASFLIAEYFRGCEKESGEVTIRFKKLFQI